MSGELRLALPGRVVATYLVLAPQTLANADVAVSQAAADLAPAVRATLAEHIGDLRIVAADLGDLPVPPAPLLRFGTSAAASASVATAITGWGLLLSTGPEQARSADVAVRAAASILARRVGGVVVDPSVPRAVLPGNLPLSDAAADVVVLRPTVDAVGIQVTTAGLQRFGLPELMSAGADERQRPAWDAGLVAVAHVLLRGLSRLARGAEALEVPSQLSLGLDDVAAGYGQPAPAAPVPRTQVSLSPITSGDGDRLVVSGRLPELFGDALAAVLEP